MLQSPQALVESLIQHRCQIDAAIKSISLLFLSSEPPPTLPPPPVQFRTTVELAQDREGQSSPRTTGTFRPNEGPLRPDALSGMIAWEACEAYLLHRGNPARTAEIALALERHGFRSTAKDLRGFVYQVLRKKPDIFTHPSQGSWGLKVWG